MLSEDADLLRQFWLEILLLIAEGREGDQRASQPIVFAGGWKESKMSASYASSFYYSFHALLSRDKLEVYMEVLGHLYDVGVPKEQSLGFDDIADNVYNMPIRFLYYCNRLD